MSVPVPDAHRHLGFRDERFVFGTMEGAVQQTGYFAIRLKLDVSYTLEDSATGAKTHEKYCMQPGTLLWADPVGGREHGRTAGLVERWSSPTSTSGRD